MGERQSRHLPRSQSQLAKGKLSKGRIRAPQDLQWDGGAITD